jgi:hypothetical protein
MKNLKYLLFMFVFCFINVNALEKSINDYSYGVDGRVVIKSISEKMNEDEEESLILSTSTGIYITLDDKYLHIDTVGTIVDTKVINDINNDGTKDIVYATNDAGSFYNLVAVSGSDGEILWKTKISEETYDYSAGFVDNNESLYKLEIINNNIVVIYDYTVEMFNYETGESIFKYVDKDNIWDLEQILDINSDSTIDFVLANQLGEVSAINGSNGKVLWKSKIIEDFNVLENKNVVGTVTRNVWQVLFINKTLYAMGEDGTLYVLDYKTGNISNSLNVFKIEDDALNSYYNSYRYDSSYIQPIGKNSEYFKDFEMFEVGEGKLLITAFVNGGEPQVYYYENVKEESSSYSDTSLYGGRPLLILVDLNKVEVIESVTLNEMELSNVEPLYMNDESFIVMPIYVKEGNLIVNIYDSTNLSKTKSYEMYIGDTYSSSIISSIYSSIYNDNVLIEAKNYFSIISDLTDVIKNNNTYATPSVIEFKDDELLLSYSLDNKVIKLVKYSSVINKTIAWEYYVTDDFSNNGMESITITKDFNNDSVLDLVALVNRLDEDNNIESSYILVLDMKTGEPISFKNKLLSFYYQDGKRINVYLTGSTIYAISDITGDRKIDFVMDSSILNGVSYNVVGIFNTALKTDGVSRIIKVGDVNGDGFEDLVTIEETVAYLHLSKKTYSSIVYTRTNTKYTYSKTLLNYDYATLISDIDNDGIDDIVFNAENSVEKQYYKIVSGKTLKEISRISEDGITSSYSTYSVLDSDINGDGYNDLYESKNWGATYSFISGKDGSEIISLTINAYGEFNDGYDEIKRDDGYSGEDGLIPFTLVDRDYSITLGNDINDDEHPELLFLKETYYPKQEVILQIYDVYNKNNTPLKEIVINSTSNNGGIEPVLYNDMVMESEPYIYISKLVKKISNTDDLYIIKSSSGNSLIYDLDNESIISGFTDMIFNATKIDDNTLFCVDLYGQPLNINYENTFTITNIEENNTYTSPLNIEWTYEDYGGMNIVNIYDNGVYIKTSYGSDADILLREGDHLLTFESVDRWGKVLNGSIEISIEKPNIIKMVFSFVSLILILLTLAISIGPKIRRNVFIRRLSK